MLHTYCTITVTLRFLSWLSKSRLALFPKLQCDGTFFVPPDRPTTIRTICPGAACHCQRLGSADQRCAQPISWQSPLSLFHDNLMTSAAISAPSDLHSIYSPDALATFQFSKQMCLNRPHHWGILYLAGDIRHPGSCTPRTPKVFFPPGPQARC
ncbi:hypothetical protein BC826DRAFT_303147 [Russula brevipes]|nr:hypothetical protein BC826DRAFT_303147 [Russula brevipes]